MELAEIECDPVDEIYPLEIAKSQGDVLTGTEVCVSCDGIFIINYLIK